MPGFGICTRVSPGELHQPRNPLNAREKNQEKSGSTTSTAKDLYPELRKQEQPLLSGGGVALVVFSHGLPRDETFKARPCVFLSPQVAGFDWTPPRQVVVAELMRPTRAGSTDSDGGGSSSSSSRGGETPGGGVSTMSEHAPGISLQSVPCRNMSNQILYLSVEAASVRVRNSLPIKFIGLRRTADSGRTSRTTSTTTIIPPRKPCPLSLLLPFSS